MYGIIHVCLKELVLRNHGERTWNLILETAECDDKKDFLNFRQYPDSVTHRLIQTAGKVLGLSENDIMEAFGEYFLHFALARGYGDIFMSMSRNFKEFVDNIDYFHWYLMSTAFSGIQSPSFSCSDDKNHNNALILSYYSRRKGYHPLAVGLIKEIGRSLFKVETQFVQLDYKEELQENDSMLYSVVYRVFQVSSDFSRYNLHSGDDREGTVAYPTNNNRIGAFLPSKDTYYNSADSSPSHHSISSGETSLLSATGLLSIRNDNTEIDEVVFSDLHPYHCLFDELLQVIRLGPGFLRLCSSLQASPGRKLTDVFKMIWPRMPLTLVNMQRFVTLVFQFELITANKKEHGAVFKGQIIKLKTGHMLMVSTPLSEGLQDLTERNLRISDIPRHDSTREVILLKHQRTIEFNLMQRLEETTLQLQETADELEREKERTDQLLHSIMPAKVVSQLKAGEKVHETFDQVTILFSDIVTFTEIASQSTPFDIVNMLNSLYTYFDELTVKNQVYKVETIGDAYMVVGGVPIFVADHAERVADQAFGMVEVSKRVASPVTGKPLQIRVGIHSGPVVAGVVGVTCPRYCLFGDTVNTASRMESHGVPGKIHISPETQKFLSKSPNYISIKRGEMAIKGKGNMTTYFLLRKENDQRLPDMIDEVMNMRPSSPGARWIELSSGRRSTSGSGVVFGTRSCTPTSMAKPASAGSLTSLVPYPACAKLTDSPHGRYQQRVNSIDAALTGGSLGRSPPFPANRLSQFSRPQSRSFGGGAVAPADETNSGRTGELSSRSRSQSTKNWATTLKNCCTLL